MDNGDTSTLSLGGVGGGKSFAHAWARRGGKERIDMSADAEYDVTSFVGVLGASNACFTTSGTCIPLVESRLDECR